MSCTILLVEDDPLSRRNLKLFLRNAAHNVYEAGSGQAALELISRVAFDAVVSDFRLPGAINGIDVLRHQATLMPGKRLILLTAYGSNDVRCEAERLGAEYREKPISLSDLLTSLQSRD